MGRVSKKKLSDDVINEPENDNDDNNEVVEPEYEVEKIADRR